MLPPFARPWEAGRSAKAEKDRGHGGGQGGRGSLLAVGQGATPGASGQGVTQGGAVVADGPFLVNGGRARRAFGLSCEAEAALSAALSGRLSTAGNVGSGRSKAADGDNSGSGGNGGNATRPWSARGAAGAASGAACGGAFKEEVINGKAGGAHRAAVLAWMFGVTAKDTFKEGADEGSASLGSAIFATRLAMSTNQPLVGPITFGADGCYIDGAEATGGAGGTGLAEALELHDEKGDPTSTEKASFAASAAAGASLIEGADASATAATLTLQGTSLPAHVPPMSSASQRAAEPSRLLHVFAQTSPLAPPSSSRRPAGSDSLTASAVGPEQQAPPLFPGLGSTRTRTAFGAASLVLQAAHDRSGYAHGRDAWQPDVVHGAAAPLQPVAPVPAVTRAALRQHMSLAKGKRRGTGGGTGGSGGGVAFGENEDVDMSGHFNPLLPPTRPLTLTLNPAVAKASHFTFSGSAFDPGPAPPLQRPATADAASQRRPSLFPEPTPATARADVPASQTRLSVAAALQQLTLDELAPDAAGKKAFQRGGLRRRPRTAQSQKNGQELLAAGPGSGGSVARDSAAAAAVVAAAPPQPTASLSAEAAAAIVSRPRPRMSPNLGRAGSTAGGRKGCEVWSWPHVPGAMVGRSAGLVPYAALTDAAAEAAAESSAAAEAKAMAKRAGAAIGSATGSAMGSVMRSTNGGRSPPRGAGTGGTGTGGAAGGRSESPQLTARAQTAGRAVTDAATSSGAGGAVGGAVLSGGSSFYGATAVVGGSLVFDTHGAHGALGFKGSADRAPGFFLFKRDVPAPPFAPPPPPPPPPFLKRSDVYQRRLPKSPAVLPSDKAQVIAVMSKASEASKASRSSLCVCACGLPCIPLQIAT